MNFNDFTPLVVLTNARLLGHSGFILRPVLGNFVQLGANLSIWSLLRNHFDPFTKNTYFADKLKKHMQPYSQFGAALGALVGNFGLTLII